MTAAVLALVGVLVTATVTLTVYAWRRHEATVTATLDAAATRAHALRPSHDFIARMRPRDDRELAQWLGGFDVIESPLVPPGTVIIGAHGLGSRTWEPVPFTGLLRLTEPLWDDRPPTWGAQNTGLADVAARERTAALDHLTGLLDGLCDRNGIDPEVWRAPRRAATTAARLRRSLAAYRAQERWALSIPRPTSLSVVTGL